MVFVLVGPEDEGGIGGKRSANEVGSKVPVGGGCMVMVASRLRMAFSSSGPFSKVSSWLADASSIGVWSPTGPGLASTSPQDNRDAPRPDLGGSTLWWGVLLDEQCHEGQHRMGPGLASMSPHESTESPG